MGWFLIMTKFKIGDLVLVKNKETTYKITKIDQRNGMVYYEMVSYNSILMTSEAYIKGVNDV